MNDKYDDAGILIRPTVKLESEMEQPENEQLRKCAELKALRNIKALSPIPAQQSQVATSDKVLFNGSHGHAGYVIEDQQSPAVAVPDLKQEYKLFCKFCDENPSLNLDPRLHTHSGQIESGGYIDQVIANVAFKAWRARADAPSPRITEQDLREIIEDYIGYCDGRRLKPQSSVVTGMYLKNEALALLNKLNKVNHETN